MQRTIYVRGNREETLAAIRSLPAILAGKVADVGEIRKNFSLRLGYALLMEIQRNFIIKSRGGAGSDGISWPPLSAKYLAYRRPMAQGGRGSRNPPRGGKHAPGDKDGLLSQSELKRWRKIYSAKVVALSASTNGTEKEIKAHAARLAWAILKKEGAQTKLAVFGNRKVDILRDRGILFNSLSPGVFTDSGESVAYSQPQEQVFETLQSSVIVGTTVPYAYYHQTKPGKRKLWPEDGLPEAWWTTILEVALTGLLYLNRLFR